MTTAPPADRRQAEVNRLLMEYEKRCSYVSELVRADMERSRIANARICGEVMHICAVLDQLKALGFEIATLVRAVQVAP